VVLDLLHGAVVQDRCEADRIGAALADDLGDVLGGARAAAGDHRNGNRVRDRARELEVETLAGALAIDRRHHELARAELDHALGPVERVEAGRLAAVVGVHLVAALRLAGRLDRHDDRR
jgi:hypothetical protein